MRIDFSLHSFTLSNSVFLALNNPSFLSHFRSAGASNEPLMTLHSFSVLWGIIFIVFTTFLFFFVPEELPKPDQSSKASKSSEPSEPSEPSEAFEPLKSQPETESEDSKPLLVRRHSPRVDPPKPDPSNPDQSYSVLSIYRLYYEIIKNPYVSIHKPDHFQFLRVALITLTNRIGVFPAEAASSLKLIEKGMQRVWLTSLRLFYFPIEMLITILMTRILSTHNPLTLMQRCYLARITMALLITCFIHFLPGHRGYLTHDV